MMDYLRELNFVSVAVRLLLSAAIGFSLGLERGRKHRPAGCRTYMLVCMGATLTLLLSQYEYYMLTHDWYDLALEVGHPHGCFPLRCPSHQRRRLPGAPVPFWSPDAGR